MEPAQITFRNIAPSDAIEVYVRDRADKLTTFSERITHCYVAIEAPHKHQHQGRHYRVRIDMRVPGGELVVSNTPDESAANQDAYAAVDEAFDHAGRALQDFVRRQRGDVKPRVDQYREATVSKLWAYEGYGFLATAEGSEVYFHRHAVLNGGFDHLKLGSAVRFIEEDGDKGPQASTVKVVG